MPTPAHTDFDSANPQGSQTPANAMTSSLNNLRALRDAILSGRLEGFVQSRTTGTGPDATRPQFITWLNATLTIGFRWNLTWSGFTVTSVADEWSNDNGATWTAINTAQANTYDASNNITATTQAGGQRGVLFEIWTKTLKVVSDFATHIAATGTAVHGLASMAIQAASAVAITGGSINGTTFGASTRASVDATRVTEGINPGYTPALNAGVALDWANGASSVTVNGTNAMSFVNVPSGSAAHMVFLTNFNAATWPGVVDWGVAGRPSIAGAAWVQLFTSNAGGGVAAGIFWRAV